MKAILFFYNKENCSFSTTWLFQRLDIHQLSQILVILEGTRVCKVFEVSYVPVFPGFTAVRAF